MRTRSEAEAQRAIVDALSMYGLRVHVTSRVRKLVRCARCSFQFRPAGGDGVTRGTPDLYVRRSETTRHGESWFPKIWLGLEVKPHRSARVRPEQRELCEGGSIAIVYSVDDALAEVDLIDKFHRCRTSVCEESNNDYQSTKMARLQRDRAGM